MAEHSELVSEMAILEKLGTQERLKMAKKRRLQQLKKWSQREKELNNATKKNKKNDLNDDNDKNSTTKRKRTGRIHFVPSVMLLEAAARNDVEEVRRLLMMGVNPDSTNEDGLTALHQCCIDDSEEMMKLLIEFGANVNAKDSEQWTPLHAAATCGHLHLVRYLIEKGANLLAVNADNNMPYDICEHEETLDYIEQQMASRGITQQQIDETRSQVEMEMLEFLKRQLQSGVDLNTIKFGCNASALHVAAAYGWKQLVEFLLENNIQINVDDEDNWKPIHAAVCWGQPEILEILAQAGADLDARTKNGETLFDICEDLELKEQIEQLKSEMESKQQLLLQQQSLNGSRLRRSHSQNTRSQSVRRTSIREKNNTSRREAREEAKIRHHLDSESKLTDVTSTATNKQAQSSQTSASNQTSKSSSSLEQQNVTSINNVTNVTNINNQSFNPHLNQFTQQNSLNIPLNSSSFSVQDQQKSQDNQMNLMNRDNLRDNNSRDNNSRDNNSRDNNLRDKAFRDNNHKDNQQIKSNDNQNDSLKLEIHVNNNHVNGHNNLLSNNTLNNFPTNCSNVNTLSDLKKFRNDLRHRNYTNSEMKESMMGNELYSNKTTSDKNMNNEQVVDGLVVNRFSNQNKINNKMSNTSSHNNNYLNQSPNSTIKFKFRGDPSNMIGDEMQKRKCCSMM